MLLQIDIYFVSLQDIKDILTNLIVARLLFVGFI